jgi:hypothetical protein
MLNKYLGTYLFLLSFCFYDNCQNTEIYHNHKNIIKKILNIALNLGWDLNEILGSYIVKDPIILVLVLVLVLVYNKEKYPLNARVLSRFINC